MVTRLDINDPGFEEAFNRLLGAKRETDTDVDDVVAGILADVRARGDEAVLAYTKEFDGYAEVDESPGAVQQCADQTENGLGRVPRVPAFPGDRVDRGWHDGGECPRASWAQGHHDDHAICPFRRRACPRSGSAG